MDCIKAQELFTAIADNDPDSETTARFHAHLVACQDCTREWECFQATLRCLQALDFAPPADLMAGINARIHRPNPFIRFCLWLKNANPTFSLPTAFATVTIAFACMLIYKNILTNDHSGANPAPPWVAEHPDQSPSTCIDAEKRPATPKAFAFRQDLIQPATNPLFEQGYGYGSALQPIYSQRNNSMETTTDIFSNSYAHRYLKHQNPPATCSDLVITLHPRDQKSNTLLHHCLLAEKKWNTQANGRNRYLLTLDRQELQNLQKLLATHADAPPLPENLLARIEARTINVTINLK